MKIALIGYGKMGRTIETIAQRRGHEVVARLHSSATTTDWKTVELADVCIEFTHPGAARVNVLRCLEMNKPVVCGTTGWQGDIETVKQRCAKLKGSFLWASNFSIGVNLFWEANRHLAELMNRYTDYGVSIEEIHHTQKKDAPSGTAITTAEQIVDRNDRYSVWKLETERTQPSELPIRAVRTEDVKGTHIVTYESDLDKVELKHEAKSREGFAAGAVMAAEFIADRRGVYAMGDVLGL